MKIKNILAAFVVICFSVNLFAADISGQVVTTNGTPICALVLASGRSMFSCNPVGQFSLSGLALEPDGSVNLQVYADGFLPFISNLTQFDPQTVVMTSASRPVNSDGLSDQSPLDGTYTLTRVSVFFGDNTIWDSAGGSLVVEGTMKIEGDAINQFLSVTINGQTTDIAVFARLHDFGHYLTINELGLVGQSYLVLVERGDKVITEFNAAAWGGDFSEVDHWVKQPSEPLLIQSLSVSEKSYLPATGTPGSVVGDLIDSQGLRSLIAK